MQAAACQVQKTAPQMVTRSHVTLWFLTDALGLILVVGVGRVKGLGPRMAVRASWFTALVEHME